MRRTTLLATTALSTPAFPFIETLLAMGREYAGPACVERDPEADATLVAADQDKRRVAAPEENAA